MVPSSDDVDLARSGTTARRRSRRGTRGSAVGLRDVEGLQVALPEGHVADGDRQDEGRALAQRPAVGRLRLRPALRRPTCRRSRPPSTTGAGPGPACTSGVAQASPQRRVEAVGEAEVAADADPAGGAAGPGELGRRRRSRRRGRRGRRRSRRPRPGPGRRPGTRRPAPAGRGRRRPPPVDDAASGQHQARRRDPAAAAGRRPHLGQAPQAEAGPGHDVEAEAEVDRLGAADRHQAGRCTEREEQVAPGRARGRSGRPGRMTRRTVSGFIDGVMSAVGERHRVEEPDEGGDGAERPPGPSPTPAAGPGCVARRPCRPTTSTMAPTRRRPGDLVQGGTGGDGHEDGAQAGDPQPDGVLRGPGPVGPPDRVEHAHGAAAPPPGRRRRPVGTGHRPAPAGGPALRRSATGATHRTRRLDGAEEDRCARRRARLHDRAERPFGDALGLVGVVGQRPPSTVTGSADGRSSSRTINSPAWAVARQCTRRRLSPGRVRAGTPRAARVGPRPVDAPSPVSSCGHRARPGRPAAAGRDVERRRAAGAAPAASTTAARTEPPRRCRASTAVVHAAARRHQGDAVADRRRCRPGRPDEDLGAGRLDRPDAQPGAASTSDVHRQAGDGVGRGAADDDPGAGHDDADGPTMPMRSAPKTRSPRSCTHPAPPLWATSHHRRRRSPPRRPSAPPGRAGRAQRLTVSARASPRGAPGPLRPTARAPRRPRRSGGGGPGSATATAFTSSGTT